LFNVSIVRLKFETRGTAVFGLSQNLPFCEAEKDREKMAMLGEGVELR